MKKLYLIILILLLIVLLSSCELIDTNLINETFKPTLKASPINGKWELTETLISDSRDSYKIGDEFLFNIEFFSTKDQIYYNPEYEIIRINAELYISDKSNRSELGDLIEEEINVVEMMKDGLIIGEVVPLNRDNILLHINNEILKLKRVTDGFSESEINEIKMSYSEKEEVFKAGNNWGLSLGIRALDNNGTEDQGYKYFSLLVRNNKGLQVDQVNGLVINNYPNVDIYNIERKEVDGVLMDTILLNEKILPIMDVKDLSSSNLFRLTYLSSNYASIEYLNGQGLLNTMSTYSANTKEGFKQLKVDDIADYSYERILDAITSSESQITFAEAIYNIGIGRENGFTVLKGRVPTNSSNEKFNRDYVISTDFNYSTQTTKRLNLQELKVVFPNLIDAYSTPLDNQIIVVSKDLIEIYSYDKPNKKYERLYKREIPQNFSIVSVSWFNDLDINNFETTINSTMAK